MANMCIHITLIFLSIVVWYIPLSFFVQVWLYFFVQVVQYCSLVTPSSKLAVLDCYTVSSTGGYKIASGFETWPAIGRY